MNGINFSSLTGEIALLIHIEDADLFKNKHTSYSGNVFVCYIRRFCGVEIAS